MKQRLAIAATLLKDPDLLIFDEPTNGLDPAGIHEIRTMMRSLASRGKTVLVSSHILSEVQQIADTVTIIGRGRLLAEGDVNDILADGQLAARVGVSDHMQATEVLTTSGFTVERLPNRILKVSLGNRRLDLAVITRLLADQGLYVSELTPIQPDLESVFLDLTAGQHLGARQERRRQPASRRPAPRSGGQHSSVARIGGVSQRSRTGAVGREPACLGGIRQTAESAVHRHRDDRAAAWSRRIQLAVNDALAPEPRTAHDRRARTRKSTRTG